MNHSRLAAAFVLYVGFATASGACPWASATYAGVVPPDIEVTATFNADCSSVQLVDSGSAPMTLATSATAQGWQVGYDTTTLVFDTKGKRVKARRGGAQRSVRMRKQ